MTTLEQMNIIDSIENDINNLTLSNMEKLRLLSEFNEIRSNLNKSVESYGCLWKTYIVILILLHDDTAAYRRK